MYGALSPLGPHMSIDINQLYALPDAEKLRIVELLWDDLGDSTAPIPLPE